MTVSDNKHRTGSQTVVADQPNCTHVTLLKPRSHDAKWSRTCGVRRVFPYVHVEVVERYIDVGATAAAAAHEVGAGGDGERRVWRQKLSAMLHDDTAVRTCVAAS